jgi:16S rRNA (uracil1498-N3)-methyltransferase
MLIALPNKQEKLELIIQKLTEIGISNIYLWSSERSQLNSLNENKTKRIEKIVKEAVEQSR